MKTAFLLACVLVVAAVAGNGQTNNKADPLIVTPGKFKLLTTNVSYHGEECSPRSKDDYDPGEVLRVGNDAYYEGHRSSTRSLDDGLVAENIAAKTCRLYPMFALAKAAGWYKPKEDEGGPPNATRGLYRVRNSLWMGSNGIGIAVFDLKRKTWSRIDLKSSVVGGDHLGVDYADNDYVFITRGEFPGASVHIYSVKKDRWLGLKAISTELVREFGYETAALVQIIVDHRRFAKEKYLPVDWTLMYPDVTSINNGKSYLFERKFSENKTAFEISKSQLEELFKRN